MAKYVKPQSNPHFDAIFAALADPTRRHILERLTIKDLTVTQIADNYGFALPTISKHLSVLEKAQLIRKQKIGRHYQVHFEANTMKKIADYLTFYTKFWTKQLDNLETFLKKGIHDR